MQRFNPIACALEKLWTSAPLSEWIRMIALRLKPREKSEIGRDRTSQNIDQLDRGSPREEPHLSVTNNQITPLQTS
jgi:hypothetical protein